MDVRDRVRREGGGREGVVLPRRLRCFRAFVLLLLIRGARCGKKMSDRTETQPRPSITTKFRQNTTKFRHLATLTLPLANSYMREKVRSPTGLQSILPSTSFSNGRLEFLRRRSAAKW